jgi:hypothetical protein
MYHTITNTETVRRGSLYRPTGKQVLNRYDQMVAGDGGCGLNTNNSSGRKTCVRLDRPVARLHQIKHDSPLCERNNHRCRQKKKVDRKTPVSQGSRSTRVTDTHRLKKPKQSRSKADIPEQGSRSTKRHRSKASIKSLKINDESNRESKGNRGRRTPTIQSSFQDTTESSQPYRDEMETRQPHSGSTPEQLARSTKGRRSKAQLYSTKRTDRAISQANGKSAQYAHTEQPKLVSAHDTTESTLPSSVDREIAHTSSRSTQWTNPELPQDQTETPGSLVSDSDTHHLFNPNQTDTSSVATPRSPVSGETTDSWSDTTPSELSVDDSGSIPPTKLTDTSSDVSSYLAPPVEPDRPVKLSDSKDLYDTITGDTSSSLGSTGDSVIASDKSSVSDDQSKQKDESDRLYKKELEVTSDASPGRKEELANLAKVKARALVKMKAIARKIGLAMFDTSSVGFYLDKRYRKHGGLGILDHTGEIQSEDYIPYQATFFVVACLQYLTAEIIDVTRNNSSNTGITPEDVRSSIASDSELQELLTHNGQTDTINFRIGVTDIFGQLTSGEKHLQPEALDYINGLLNNFMYQLTDIAVKYGVPRNTQFTVSDFTKALQDLPNRPTGLSEIQQNAIRNANSVVESAESLRSSNP